MFWLAKRYKTKKKKEEEEENILFLNVKLHNIVKVRKEISTYNIT